LSLLAFTSSLHRQPPAAISTAMPTALLNPKLSAVHKGFPHQSPPLSLAAIGQQGWNVLRGDLPFPLAVIRQAALTHNLQWMQAYARSQGVDLAPHGKTTMSPQLFARQLDAGAWGMTVANVTQLQTALAAGATNCLIANQVFAANDLAQISQLVRSHAGLRIVFLVDSLAQLACIEQWHAQSVGASLPALAVLLEIGVAAGRTGCRSHEQALQLAQRIKASPAVKLVGIECYEGLGATGQSGADGAYASDLMQRVNAIARACDAQGLFEADEVLLSAGGSGIFDLVAPHLKPPLSRSVRGILRSGCYVTHDQGSYQRLGQVMASRLAQIGCGNGLHAALEVWAAVQSVPEPGLAILTVGKRDISYDQAMPSALRYVKCGSATLQAAPADWKVTALNDQHAYLRSSDAALAGLAVGDLVCLGLSHPCTTFDKWRWMPLVDEQYNVVDAIVTCF
jgi:D-serine dehydratase